MAKKVLPKHQTKGEVKPTKTVNWSGKMGALNEGIKKKQGDTTVVVNKVPFMTSKDSSNVAKYVIDAKPVAKSKKVLAMNKKGGSTKKK
jgi:hypothetical protein